MIVCTSRSTVDDISARAVVDDEWSLRRVGLLCSKPGLNQRLEFFVRMIPVAKILR